MSGSDKNVSKKPVLCQLLQISYSRMAILPILWQLGALLRIGLAMNDSPSAVFAPKHHRYPQVESRLVRPTRNTKSNVLGLDEISELVPDRRPNFLSAACTFGKL